MRKIILASKSKARRKLLRDAGLKFITAESRVREKRRIYPAASVGSGTCAALVVENARRKAEDASAGFRSGVVIAADTVVLVGKKIIGKPRSINDAFRTLKMLSRKPQWVYTGIAVKDIDRNRTYTDFEKTKVYMYPLSGKEIKNYFKRVNPLEKAGSFDIQGLGGVFIDRIEGCFYNVVGLPVAKLARMLKKTGIRIFG